MHQEPYFFPSGTKLTPGDTGLQYQDPYQMQPTMGPWPNSLVSNNMSVPPGIFNNDETPLQCNESPSLLTPVSTAVYGTTSTFSWAHSVPNLMPWVPRAEVTVPDPIVRFSAPFPPDPCTSQTATSWELLHNLGANKPNPNIHLKRKSDLDLLDATPQKVCVTEEKMAARFREMHISNSYSVPGENFCSVTNTTSPTGSDKSVTNLQQLEVMLQDTNSSDLSSKSIVLAPELKKLVEPEKIFSTFLNKIERPSMALVVWQPPNNRLANDDSDNKQNIGESQSPTVSVGENNNVMQEQLNVMCQQYLSSHGLGNDQTQAMNEEGMDT